MTTFNVQVFDEYERFSCTVQVHAVDEEEAWMAGHAKVHQDPRAQTWTMCPATAYAGVITDTHEQARWRDAEAVVALLRWRVREEGAKVIRH